GQKIRAKALLSYGNSTQKDSPYNGDQLALFSKRELRNIWFYETELISNIVKVEIRNGDKFILDK
ncbi:MAG: hypothetical protein HOF97_06235, partial [Candidatus Marinimicrobia bacterium]|nr:hypothetical protein [Candidatus Neomarinimicrobiota bacterium]